MQLEKILGEKKRKKKHDLKAFNCVFGLLHKRLFYSVMSIKDKQ